MRRTLTLAGVLLLGLPPSLALALRLVPFDFVVVSPVPLPGAATLMLSGGVLLLAGLLWKRP